MIGTLTNRFPGRAALAAALAAPLLLLPAPAIPAAPSGGDVIWMRVEVHESGRDDAKVKVNLPLSLIEVVVDSIDKRQFMVALAEEHPHLDLAKLWREIRNLPIEEFMTVESEDAHIRVWKDRDFFRLNVRETDPRESSVEVQIPLDVMDFLFEARPRTFDFQELVERVRPHLPLTLVQVQTDRESARIWLEER